MVAILPEIARKRNALFKMLARTLANFDLSITLLSMAVSINSRYVMGRFVFSNCSKMNLPQTLLGPRFLFWCPFA